MKHLGILVGWGAAERHRHRPRRPMNIRIPLTLASCLFLGIAAQPVKAAPGGGW